MQDIAGWSFFSSSEEKPIPHTPQLLGPLGPPPAYFTLMIDPGEGGQDPAQTMEITQELKKNLENQVPGLRVILTRTPGEAAEPLQTALFANRLKADLYINIQSFKQQEPGINLYFYQLSYNPTTDLWQQKEQGLQLLPIDQAYRSAIKKSNALLSSFYQTCKQDALELSKEKKVQVNCKAPLSLPFKPLLGIMIPAFAVEITVKKHQSWSVVIPLFVHAIETIITQQQSTGSSSTATG